MAVINSTDLDFDQIKESLKTYLESHDQFSDYDFEASGLSNILDVLAYNTHLNGLIANIGINESFLSTAQLRSSVVSHAETLGYYSGSKSTAKASVAITLNTTDINTPQVALPKYTSFNTTIDEVSYSFKTLEEYTATNDGNGNFSFITELGSTSIPIYEGIVKTKTYLVGDTADEQIYVIPDENIDTNTLTVDVYDTTTSSSFTTYINIKNNIRLDETSTVYLVRETPNGYYEITFSDGVVLGKSPIAGNKIVIQYLSTKGEIANRGKTFIADDTILVGGIQYQPVVTTIANSSGGADKESIASIKGNAPRAFGTQQRLVTAEDYKALIMQRYSDVLNDVTAWGGNDNIPPVYGQVYVSLSFKDNIDEGTKQTTKDDIVAVLSENLAIMSINTVFSDPVITYLELDVTYDFDPDQTNITAKTQSNAISAFIVDYVNNNLKKFDSIFRRSLLLTEIDNLSTAILNSTINVRLQQRFAPILNIPLDYTLKFPTALAIPSNVNRIITTSRFTFNGEKCVIKNRLNTNILEMIRVSDALVIQDNVGHYNTGTGAVTITGLNISDFELDAIKVSAIPANQSTVKPLRNYTISFDPATSNTIANIDYQNTAITL